MKSICKIIITTFFLLQTSSVFAGTDIGFGTIKGYKIGNADNNEIAIFLNDGYERDLGNCKGQVTIKFSDYDTVRSEKRIDQMMSTIIAAYMSNKKVRFYSHKNNCEVTFVALQESYF